MTTMMTMTKNRRGWVVVLLLAGAACAKKQAEAPAMDVTRPDPAREAALSESFRAGLEEYLHRRGDLCVDRPSWPIDVTDAERAQGSRDARQLPVLARLGVVEGRQVSRRSKDDPRAAPVAVTRYQLT